MIFVISYNRKMLYNLTVKTSVLFDLNHSYGCEIGLVKFLN